MKLKYKGRVLVIGGSGYIGLHAVKEFVNRKYSVTVASRNPEKVRDILPLSVKYQKLDVNEISEDDLQSILSNYDYLVFAAGVDDRVVPKSPAFDFFYKCNVEPCKRIFSIASKAGVKKAVLISSYFCYFNRIFPEMKLSEYHPYIRARMLQEIETQRVCSPNLGLTILELPYVIGSSPNEKHLLNPLVKYLYSNFPIFVTKGGTAVITVENVAEAIVGAIENNLNNDIYPIADVNMSWKDIWREINPNKKGLVLPKWILKIGTFFVSLYYWIQGKESGLNLIRFVDLQTINTFLPLDIVRNELKYTSDGVEESFDEIVDSSLEN